MKVIIEDTDSKNENKQRGSAESEKDQGNVHEVMQLTVRALLAYGYKREDIADWLMDFAYQHQKLLKEFHDDE